MKIVSSEAMTLIDRRAQDEFAIPGAFLMEDAGVSAWSLFVKTQCQGRLPGGPLVFAAGKGNNGGDALVMARRALCQGAPRPVHRARRGIALAGRVLRSNARHLPGVWN